LTPLIQSRKPRARMAAVAVIETVLLIVAILGAVRTMHFFRARAMRRFASKWGLQYMGPTAPPQWWWNTSQPKIPSPLPGWTTRLGISQAWNIIEGKNKGMQVFVFDGVLGKVKSRPRTYIACQTQQSPFGISKSVESEVQMHGWTVLQGVWFLWFSWFMSVGRLNRHLDSLEAESPDAQGSRH